MTKAEVAIGNLKHILQVLPMLEAHRNHIEHAIKVLNELNCKPKGSLD